MQTCIKTIRTCIYGGVRKQYRSVCPKVCVYGLILPFPAVEAESGKMKRSNISLLYTLLYYSITPSMAELTRMNGEQVDLS